MYVYDELGGLKMVSLCVCWCCTDCYLSVHRDTEILSTLFGVFIVK